MNKDLIKAAWREIDNLEHDTNWIEIRSIEVDHDDMIYYFNVFVEWVEVDRSFSHAFGYERVIIPECMIKSITLVDDEGREIDVTSYFNKYII